MDIRGYLGIDFGTANSHFAYCEVGDGAVHASAIPLDGAENHAAVPSYLLWETTEDSKRRPKAYGVLAIDEWILADDENNDGNKSRYLLTGAFKPDLVSSPLSRAAAREFLAFARKNMEKTRLPPGLGQEPHWNVVIGVPAEIGSEHRKHTVEAAMAAGFDQVSCLEEPLGAVAYHLANRQIDESDLERCVLVVDFGGGTLDLATVDRTGVTHPWGDPQLGGRLFDDLFFQWVVDVSRVNLRDFSSAELLALWWIDCRRLKESFSKHWRSKAEAGEAQFTGFKGRIPTRDGGTFGALRGVGLGEFLERARAYQPSLLARSYFNKIGSPLQNLGVSGPVDLLDWIKQVLAGGPNKRHGTVILTGGSSSWPFMQPMVREVFGDCEILIPNNPDCTIGEGLAMYNVLRHQYQGRQQQAIEDLDSLKGELDKVVDEATEQAGQDISQEIVSAIMEISRREFHAWREQGGRLADVELAVSQACQCIPSRQIAQQRLTRLLPDIEKAGSEAVRNWLAQHDIKGSYDGMHLNTGVGVRDLTLNITLADELADAAVLKAVGYVTVATLGGLTAVIALTSVTIAASPLAFLVPFLALGIYAARDKVKKLLLDYKFEGEGLEWLQRLYSRNKLEEALRKGEIECREAISAAITEAMKGVRVTLNPLVDDALREVIRRYGLLDRLSKIKTDG